METLRIMKVHLWRRACFKRNFNILRNLYFKASVHSSNKHADDFSHTISDAGYRGESYMTKTDDGYILRMHRCLPKRHSTFKGSTLLMHGLFRNSFDFISTGPKIALAYYLADNGYDVWLGNARGTKYSMEHEKHHHKSKDFWKFSFHEIGFYDVSAMLDFMLDQTKETKTFYVGHSQGTSSLLALLSSQPKYNENILQGHLLAPAVFMSNSTCPIMTTLAKRSEAVMVSGFLILINFQKYFFTLQKYSSRVGRLNIAPLLKLSHKLCNINGFNFDTAMKLYKNITCPIIGDNSKQVEIADVCVQLSLIFI